MSITDICFVVLLTVTCIVGMNIKFLAGIQNISTERYCFESDNFDYFYVQVWPWNYVNTGFFIPCMFLLCGNIVIVFTLWRKNNEASLHRNTAIKNKVSVVTKRVTVLNSTYIVCGSRICLYVIINLFGWLDFELVNTILTMLMLTNNSISFFL